MNSRGEGRPGLAQKLVDLVPIPLGDLSRIPLLIANDHGFRPIPPMMQESRRGHSSARSLGKERLKPSLGLVYG